MNYDAIIVYAFLLMLLVVGLWAGRTIKDIKEYAITNRAYGTGVLTMTMLATYITGSQVIGYVGYIFERGIIAFLATFLCGVVACFLFIGRYIAPNIRYFEGCLTLADVMGKLYGNKVRVWVGILGIFYCLIMTTLQIIWIGHIGEIINIPKQLSMLIGGLFLVFYSAKGGMKAVTITDIFQFLAVTILVGLAVKVLSHQLTISDIITYVPASKFNFLKYPKLKDYFVYCLQGLFPAFPLSFPFIQRMLMAKDKRQLVTSQYISIFCLAAFYLSLTFIGIVAICLHNMGNIHIPEGSSKVFIYLIKNYFPVGLKGVMSVGLLAVVISTADSFLQSAGILMGYDIIPSLWNKRKHINTLKLSQYATLLLGLIALYIALSQQILPRVQYGNMHWGKGINMARDFVGVVFTIPLIAGIMGLKTESKSFFISMGVTFVAFFIGKLFLADLWFMPMVILINATTFFATNYIQNKGFVTVKRDTVLLA